MYIQYFSKFILICFAAVFIFSCESHEKKADAYVRSQYSINVSKGEKKTTKANVVKQVEAKKIVMKVEAANEWQQFKLETEKKIISNDKKIKKIKSNPKTTQKMGRQLANLEEANNDLKIQLAIFNEEVIVKWENFKTTMNHDVNKIEIDLEDITTK